MTEEEKRKQRFTAIIVAYPFALLLIGVATNWFVLGVNPPITALPSVECIFALVVAAVLLIINHIWLMTTTELTRLKYKIYATPEE